jgi:hypothetical protein
MHCQVLDFIDLASMPQHEALRHPARRIKGLARLRAAFAQSYPQQQWKD